MAAGTMQQANRAKLILAIDHQAADPIPPSLTIYHGGKQTVCQVEVLREKTNDPQGPPQPPDPGQGHLGAEVVADLIASGQVGHLWPGRIRRHVIGQFLAHSTPRVGAPAAIHRLGVQRSTGLGHAPSPAMYRGTGRTMSGRTPDNSLNSAGGLPRAGTTRQKYIHPNARAAGIAYNLYGTRKRAPSSLGTTPDHHLNNLPTGTHYKPLHEETVQNQESKGSHLLTKYYHPDKTAPLQTKPNSCFGAQLKRNGGDACMQRIGLENSLLSSSKRRDTCYHQMNSNPKLLHQRSQWDTPQLQDSIFLFKNRNPYHNTPPPSTVLTPKKPNSKYHLSHKAGMSTITLEDEALIQKFVGLQTEENKPLKIVVPTTAASNTNWERCILAKVISNKSMLDAPFSAAMLQAWGADPETIFRSVGKNSYLIEFQNKEDMYMAELNGPWTFRGDLVATCMVNCHQDLQSVRMEHANLWVQFHHVPINSLTEEGFDILGRQIGIPVSTHVEGFINGRRLYKLKIRVPITKPLKDKVWLDHPTLGDLKILCVYEKVSRICRFCGHLGHEIQTCPEHQRLFLLLQNPALCTNMQPSQILAPKFGLWIANPMRVPKPEEEGKPKDQSPPNPGPKRAYRDRPKQGLDLGEEGGVK